MQGAEAKVLAVINCAYCVHVYIPDICTYIQTYRTDVRYTSVPICIHIGVSQYMQV